MTTDNACLLLYGLATFPLWFPLSLWLTGRVLDVMFRFMEG